MYLILNLVRVCRRCGGQKCKGNFNDQKVVIRTIFVHFIDGEFFFNYLLIWEEDQIVVYVNQRSILFVLDVSFLFTCRYGQ